jgi:hypothetical protein
LVLFFQAAFFRAGTLTPARLATSSEQRCRSRIAELNSPLPRGDHPSEHGSPGIPRESSSSDWNPIH